jgi:type II secretory pathway pseudopilin PulG
VRAKASRADAARDNRGKPGRPRTTPNPAPTRAKSSGQAKARAKARKAKAPKLVRIPLRVRLANRLSEIDLRPHALAAKVPFVVLVIGALGVGLAVTLWLSTDAAERAYQLGNARQVNQALQQQKDALERDVLEAQAAPALAEAARGLGMVPSNNTAHLVQDDNGNWVVVGTPKPADGAAPPPLNVKLPDENPAPVRAPAPGPVASPERPVPVVIAPTTAPAPTPVPTPAPAAAVAGAPEAAAPAASAAEVPVPVAPAAPTAAVPQEHAATGAAPGPAAEAVAPVIAPAPVAVPAAPVIPQPGVPTAPGVGR